MNSLTGRSKSLPWQKRMSRLVRMPTSRPTCIDDRHAAELEAVHQRLGVVQRRAGEQRDRVGDHAALAALDLLHLGGLIGDRQVAVDDADAAFAGDGDGHAGPR